MATQTSKLQEHDAISTRPAFIFQTLALKTIPAVAQEGADQAREWAERSAAFVEEVAAAKTFGDAIQVQIAHSRNAVDSFIASGKRISELYASVIKAAHRPVAV